MTTRLPSTNAETPIVRATFLLLLLACLIPLSAVASDWQERFQRAQDQCAAISDDEYETGLIFNPEGHHTYYKRSRCLQKLAIEWRRPALCEQVRERRSLFFNGEAISREACLHAVAEQIADDRATAENIPVDDIHQLTNAGFGRPHYAGDNLLMTLSTRGTYTGTYRIVVETWPRSGSEPVVLDEYSQPLGSSGHNLRRTIPCQRLREAFGDPAPSREVPIRVTLELPLRSHADQFVLAHIPEQDRRTSHTIRFNPGGRSGCNS